MCEGIDGRRQYLTMILKEWNGTAMFAEGTERRMETSRESWMEFRLQITTSGHNTRLQILVTPVSKFGGNTD
jgi:hypothetical protein